MSTIRWRSSFSIVNCIIGLNGGPVQVALGRFAAPFGESPGRVPQRRPASVAAGNEKGIRNSEFGIRNWKKNEWGDSKTPGFCSGRFHRPRGDSFVGRAPRPPVNRRRGRLHHGGFVAADSIGRGVVVMGRRCSALVGRAPRPPVNRGQECPRHGGGRIRRRGRLRHGG